MQITADAGWWEHPDVVAEAAASELEPNRDKLAAATDVDERHLFIWINWSAPGAHYSLRGADAVPTAPLNLGRGIDVVWVAGMDITFRPPVISRLWRVSSGEPWEDLTDTVRTM